MSETPLSPPLPRLDRASSRAAGIAARATQVPGTVPAAALDRLDLLCLAGLVLLWFCLLPLRQEQLPLLLWDESRNAVNALEMSRSGPPSSAWLVPSFAGAPDHWNTKPPLLIWLAAGLMRLGLPELLALRLPSMLSALLSALLLWAACRVVLRDRLAALVSSVLLLCSLLFAGRHVGRTGDYDALLSLLVLLQALCFWRAVADRGRVRAGWFAGLAASLLLAVMTKGVAGAIAPAGLLLFAILSGRLPMLLRDGRVWALSLGCAAAVAAYYGTREMYDPGYLDAVWRNELGGRYGAVNENNAGTPSIYLRVLVTGFTAGLLLLPASLLSLRSADARRRALAGVCLCGAGTLLLVLSGASTRLGWYAAPAVPLLSLAAGLGAADGARRLAARRGAFAGRAGHLALATLLLLAAGTALWRNQVADIAREREAASGQLRYGSLFDALPGRGVGAVLVLDGGVGGAAPAATAGVREPGGGYNPMLRFHAALARERGLAVRVAAPDAAGAVPAPGEAVASCDPALRGRLERERGLRPLNGWCSLGAAPNAPEPRP